MSKDRFSSSEALWNSWSKALMLWVTVVFLMMMMRRLVSNLNAKNSMLTEARLWNWAFFFLVGPELKTLVHHHHRCPIRHWPDDNHLVPKEETGSHIMSVEEEGGSHQLKSIAHPLPDDRLDDCVSQLYFSLTIGIKNVFLNFQQDKNLKSRTFSHLENFPISRM